MSGALRILSLLGLLLGTSAAGAETDPWDHHWSKCRKFKVPIFQFRLPEVQQLFSEGKAWEKKARRELLEIENITQVTCKKWAENPNGDEPLNEFVRRFSAVSLAALELQDKAKAYLSPELSTWKKIEALEVANLGFRLDKFACGQSLHNAESRVQENLVAIQAKFAELRQKCPKAADEVIAKARAEGLRARPASVGNGGPGRAPTSVPAGKSVNGQSDITGVKPKPAGGSR